MTTIHFRKDVKDSNTTCGQLIDLVQGWSTYKTQVTCNKCAELIVGNQIEIVTNSIDTDLIARECADVLFDSMYELKGPWLHHEATFLPANVCCDHAGVQKFKQILAQAVVTVLQKYIVQQN